MSFAGVPEPGQRTFFFSKEKASPKRKRLTKWAGPRLLWRRACEGSKRGRKPTVSQTVFDFSKIMFLVRKSNTVSLLILFPLENPFPRIFGKGVAMIEVDAIKAIILDGKKLLAARNKEVKWFFLPGGQREGKESDEQCLQRELLEELGVEFTSMKFYKEIVA